MKPEPNGIKIERNVPLPIEQQPMPQRRFYTHGKLANIRNALLSMNVATDCFVWENSSDQLVRYAARQLNIKVKTRKIAKAEDNPKLKPTTIGYRIWRVT